jgi:mannobiose 2-epimerase
VLNTRILWTYSAAFRLLGDAKYREMADRAYDYIANHFWDKEYKGGYWMLDYLGNPIDAKKQVYGEAFMIYAFSEYYRATSKPESLRLAVELFEALEKYAADPVSKGYFEGYTRDWSYSKELLLSVAEHPDSTKTMNTHLHMMEAYTNLLRVWDSQKLRERLTDLINIVMDHIIDHDTWHFKLFFDDKWNSLADVISYGHDIEGSWLLVEAAEVIGDEGLIKKAEAISEKMAEAVLNQGLDADSGLYYEGDSKTIYNKGKFWWPQAEAVVGFINAWQLTGNSRYYDAAYKSWCFIENHLVDKVHGDWFEYLKEGGRLPGPDEAKADPWKGPYHNGRACMEVLTRLSTKG